MVDVLKFEWSTVRDTKKSVNRRYQRLLIAVIAMVASVSSQDARANEELLAEAQEELQVGDYKDAAKWFQKLIDQEDLDESSRVAAYIGMSRVFSEQGKYGEAEGILEKGLQRLRDSSALWAKIAELHFQTGKYTQARREVRMALDLDSQNLLSKLIKAHLLAEAGKIEEATAEYRSFVRTYNRLQPTDWESLITIGNGAAIYARWESVSPIFRFVVNTLCVDALKDNRNCWQAHILSGNLLLEKYNEGQALPEFHAALEINPHCAAALVAMARASVQDSKLDLADGFADQALKMNPNDLSSLLVKATVQVFSEDNEAAKVYLDQALSINPRNQEILGVLAAIGVLKNTHVSPAKYKIILSGRSEEQSQNDGEFTRIYSELIQRNPKPGLFLQTVGTILDSRRKYDHAEVFYRRAIEVMPQLSGPQTSLGMLYMRTGRTEDAEVILKAAFAADPFHVRVSNMKKVIDVLKSYEAIGTDHFVVRAADSDHLLASMVSDYLEEIYPELTQRYGYEPPVRTQFEIYSAAKDQSGHAWFSARMIGLPWIQTIGASTGKIVALTTPNESERKFNWMRVARHEFVHILTLQKTDFNIPHWFTEAISVTEEQIEMPVDWKKLLLKRFEKKTLFDLSNINQGFRKPKGPDDWTLAYCQSFLYAQYLQEAFGEEALSSLLDAYQTTSSTEAAFDAAFSTPIEEFEAGYRQFIEEKIRPIRRGQSPSRLSFRQAQKLIESSPTDASAFAQLALAMYPRLEFQQPVLDAIESALEIDSSNPLANALKASYLLSDEKIEEALTQLEQSSATGTQEPIYLRVQARAYQSAGRIDEAEEVLKLAIARFSLETRFYEQLLELYDKANAEGAKVSEVLETLATRDYDDISSRKRLARFNSKSKNVDAAIKWAHEAVAVDVLDIEMHRILAENYLKKRQTSRALKAYEHLVLLDKVTENDRFQFAKLLRKKNQNGRAKTVLRQLLKDDPGNTDASTLLKLIDSGL